MLEGGSTAYMRPLPGAARMYPETDVLPVRISKEHVDALVVPELITDRIERYSREYTLTKEVARQLAYSERGPAFEEAVAAGIKPSLAERAFNSTLREISRSGVVTANIDDDAILGVLGAIQEGRVAKEAIPVILSSLAGGADLEQVLATAAPQVTARDLERIVADIVAERIAFVREKGPGAAGPLMGVVMKEVRGSVDGKLVSQALTAAIRKALSP